MDSYRRDIHGPNQSNFNQNTNSSGVRGGKIKTDSISKGLEKLLNEIEDRYKLDKEVKSRAQKSCKLKTLPIREVHEYIVSTVRLVPANVRRSRNIEVSGIMGSVLYLSHLMEFRSLCRVDFRDHPGITTLVGLLGRFYKYKTCNYEKNEYLNAILESLELYESISMMRINTKLSYKLLRVFYLMVIYDNLIDASAIAKLILEQVSLVMDFLVKDGNNFPSKNRDSSFSNTGNSNEQTYRRHNSVNSGDRHKNRFTDNDGFSDEIYDDSKPLMESRINMVNGKRTANEINTNHEPKSNSSENHQNNKTKVTRGSVHTLKDDYNTNLVDDFSDDGFEAPVVRTRKKYRRNMNRQEVNTNQKDNDRNKNVDSHKPSNGMSAF